MIFLIEYNRREGKILTLKTLFSDDRAELAELQISPLSFEFIRMEKWL